MGCIVEKEEQAFISWTLLRRVAYPHIHGAARKEAKLGREYLWGGRFIVCPIRKRNYEVHDGKGVRDLYSITI